MIIVSRNGIDVRQHPNARVRYYSLFKRRAETYDDVVVRSQHYLQEIPQNVTVAQSISTLDMTYYE